MCLCVSWVAPRLAQAKDVPDKGEDASATAPSRDTQTQERDPSGERVPSSLDAGEPHGKSEGPGNAIEVQVRAKRQSSQARRGASSFEVTRDVLTAAPVKDTAALLQRAPGMFVARTQGPAVAQRYSLRGFDADHGQDIAFSVGGLPINLPSHIHGQGYADLGIVMGESVQTMRVTGGVYDPSQGDFAVAGSIDLDLGMAERGWRIKSSYGAFGTFRIMASWAPRGESDETFAAASMERSDGFGMNRASQVANGVFQARFGSDSSAWSYRALGLVRAARAQLAGVLRSDDVAAGRVGFYDVYSYPTARAQSAMATRAMLGLFADHRGRRGSSSQVGAYLSYDNLRLVNNFTGFLEKSRTLENVAGRGDLIEQQNRTMTLGIRSRHRTRTYRPADWARGAFSLGFDGRLDLNEQAQSLLDASVRNQTWDNRVDADVRGGDLGLYAEADWSLPRLRLRAGLRAAALFYDVDDRLGNFVSLTRPDDSFIQGFRRSAFGVVVGPRTSAEAMIFQWLSVRAAYGEGYRSPQARILEDGEPTPFTRVRSGDFGLRMRWAKKLRIALAGFYTHLSDDVAFDASEGRLERIGATQRVGAVFYAQSRPLDWLLAALSVTYVHATLLQPPPATAEDPQPPFVEGESLPFVPPLVTRIDLGARRALRKIGANPLVGRIGLGGNFMSQRPLPYGSLAPPIALVDLGLGLSWGPVRTSFDLFNLLNRQYAASVFNHPSHWNVDGPASRRPAQHTAAGAPRSWRATVELQL